MAKVDKGGLKLSVYGRAKTGKTRLACTFPKPLLIFGFEDGTESVKGVEGVDFLRVIGNQARVPDDPLTGQPIENYVRLDECAEACRQLATSEYKTVVVDTASRMQDVVFADVCKLEEVPIQKTMISKDMNQRYSYRTKEVLRDFLNVPRNVVVVSHEKNLVEEGDQASEVLNPEICSALSKAVCLYLNGEVDYIVQTFVREKVVDGKRVGGVEYCLRIGQHPAYVTGFRVRKPGHVPPDVIVDADYDKILSVINGEEI